MAIKNLNLNIFIGHHKTGSTSIQHWMAKNHNKMLNHNHLYPFCDELSLLYSKAQLNNQPKWNDFINALPTVRSISYSKNFQEPHNALAFKMLEENCDAKMPPWHQNLPDKCTDIFNLIHSQINYYTPEAVHIVSEVLSNFGGSKTNMIDCFYSEFSYCIPSLFVILRRPDEYLSSWYRQELCFGYPMMGSINERYHNIYRESIHFDYKKMLSGWVNKLSSEHVYITRYNDIRDKGGSLSWYLNRSQYQGSQSSENNKTNEWANPSLHPAFINLIRKSNTNLPLNKTLRMISLLKSLSQHSTLPPMNEIELYGQEFRQVLVNEFKPIDNYLGSLSGKTHFFDDLNEMAVPKTISLTEAERSTTEFLRVNLMPKLDHEQSEFLEAWIKSAQKKGP